MVTLQSRWKQKRSWNVRPLIGVVLAVVLFAAIAFAIKSVIFWLKDDVLPAAIPQAMVASDEEDSTAEYAGKLISQSERQFTVSGYTFTLPTDFVMDVLPQPVDIPRGGRYTSLRFRPPWDGASGEDATQVRVIVIDYPKDALDEDQAELDERSRLSAALERLFNRLSHNAAMLGLKRGETHFGESDGMPFARCDFSGDFRGERRAARVRRLGTALVTVEERRDVYLFSLYDSTAHRDDRELLDACVLTLRRVGSSQEEASSETPDEETDDAPAE